MPTDNLELKASYDEMLSNLKRDQQDIPKQLSNIRENFDKEVNEKNMPLSLETVFEQTNSSLDFSIYYCLSETLSQCERVIKEKPSRELSLVKTKLQEALFWLNQSK